MLAKDASEKDIYESKNRLKERQKQRKLDMEIDQAIDIVRKYKHSKQIKKNTHKKEAE